MNAWLVAAWPLIAQPDDAAAREASMRAMDVWADCMIDNADALAKQEPAERAGDLADAALARCLSERNGYKEAVWRQMPRAPADEIMGHVERAESIYRQSLLSRIFKFRADFRRPTQKG